MEEKKTSYVNNPAGGELHPVLLVREIFRKLWAIVMVAVIAASLAYVGASLLYKPQYQTRTTFVVSVRDGSSTVYSNLNAAKSMASTFSEVLNSDVLKKRIAAELGREKADGSISAEVVGETNLLEMRVTAESPRQAYNITKAILRNYEELASVVLKNITLDVLQSPTVPTAPVNSAGAMRYAKLAAIAAALATALLIGARAYMRDTVKSVSEVETKLDTKMLAAVYHEKKYKYLGDRFGRKKKSILITDPTTGFAFAETFKKLRTRIEYLMRKNNCKVIMVTSVMENVGKSTVAANIALSMNRKRKSVLLIDADMKKPALHKILGYQDAEFASLTDYLNGTANLGQTLLADKKQQIGLVLNKHGVNNSTELIRSEGMKKLLAQAKRNVDVVIIDTPPMDACPDAECLTELADAVILVVRQDATPARMINDAIDAINASDAMLFGCIFNNVYAADINESYSYGSSGKYGYGKYGYSKYGSGKTDRHAQEKLTLENERDGKGFLEDDER